MARFYVPKVGDKVKLRLPEHYSELVQPSLRRIGMELGASVRERHITQEQADELKERLLADRAKLDVPTLWAWFEVREAGPESCRLRHILRAVNAPDPAWEGEVPTVQISPPLGWSPTYTIYCKNAEQASRVLQSWFEQGIHVWTSHDLSCAGRMAYTPAKEEKPHPPHWQFGDGPVETVPPELCESVFSIIWIEEWMPDLPQEKKARRRKIAELRKELEATGATLEFVRDFGNSTVPVCQREVVIHRATERGGRQWSTDRK